MIARQICSLSPHAQSWPICGEPGVLDLTPLRELVSELTEELQRVRPRERIARALRQAADVIDPPASAR